MFFTWTASYGEAPMQSPAKLAQALRAGLPSGGTTWAVIERDIRGSHREGQQGQPSGGTTGAVIGRDNRGSHGEG